MFVVFYFFIIRPQQSKIKKEKEFESALKVGEKIITKSGIHGKIAEIAEINTTERKTDQRYTVVFTVSWPFGAS